MDKKNFIKNTEDFICEHCGRNVKGDGYTNHCPKCLYSKHVDNVPGDRANNCHGLMPPVGIEYKNKQYSITHKCLKCGKGINNKTSPNDDFDKIIELSKQYLV